MTRTSNAPQDLPFKDRRKITERRLLADRRGRIERRRDTRNDGGRRRRSMRVWIRSLMNARLGVDRRKVERRSGLDRRKKSLQSLLSKDEIRDLLSE